MAELDIFSEEFARQAGEAWAAARRESLEKGLSVFYSEGEIEVMEQPDGRRFEIRFLPGKPRGENYEVLRELSQRAA